MPETNARRQVKKCGVDTHGERAQRAYNGGFGAESPAGSRGRSLVRKSGGAKPPEAENLVGKFQDGHFELNVRKRRVSRAPNHDQICINLRNDLWQKWGGHVHPSPPHGDALGQIPFLTVIVFFISSLLIIIKCILFMNFNRGAKYMSCPLIILNRGAIAPLAPHFPRA